MITGIAIRTLGGTDASLSHSRVVDIPVFIDFQCLVDTTHRAAAGLEMKFSLSLSLSLVVAVMYLDRKFLIK